MRIFLIALPLLILSGCIGLKVRVSEQPGYSFESLEKYCWLQGCEFSYQGPYSLQETFTVETFESAIVNNLQDKGYILDEGDPDFLVNMTILLEEKSHKMLYVGDFEGISAPRDREEEIHYLKGTLLFDAIDMEQTEVFWRSSAERFLDYNVSFDEKQIQKAIDEVLKQFPRRIQEKVQ